MENKKPHYEAAISKSPKSVKYYAALLNWATWRPPLRFSEVAKRGRITTVKDMLTVEQIVEETKQWPVDAVAEVLDRIALAKHGGMNAARMDAWGATALRRCAELDNGQAELIPGEEASARIRKIVGR